MAQRRTAAQSKAARKEKRVEKVRPTAAEDRAGFYVELKRHGHMLPVFVTRNPGNVDYHCTWREPTSGLMMWGQAKEDEVFRALQAKREREAA